MTQKSPLDLAREYEARLEHYLSNVDALPARHGKLNVSAVAEACGFDRQIIYKNKHARAMVDAAVREKGLVGIEPLATEANSEDAMVPMARLLEEQRRSAALEKRLSEMTARNAGLRAKLRQQTMIADELIARGRRAQPNGKNQIDVEGEN